MKRRPIISAKSTSQLTEWSPCAEGSQCATGEATGWMFFWGKLERQIREKAAPFGPNKHPPPYYVHVVPFKSCHTDDGGWIG